MNEKVVQPEEIAPHALRVLRQDGYRVHAEALRIVDLSFDFDQVLTGPDGHQLVLLVDQPERTVDALQRRLSSLTYALSRTGSRRPVTLVLVAPSLEQDDLDALRHLARLVAIDRVSREVTEVDHILREFRPLATTDVSAPLMDALDELDTALGSNARHPEVSKLIKAAAKGQEAIEEAFQRLLDEAIRGAATATP